MTEQRVNRWAVIVDGTTKLLATLIVAGIVTALCLLLLRQTSGRQTLNQVKKGTENTGRILDFVLDCTTPNGACYKQQQANQADVLRKVEDIVVLASVCARQHPDGSLDAIETCVQAGLS